MKQARIALLALAAAAAGGAAAFAQSHAVVTGPTHDCAQAPHAAVEASGGTFAFTGTCESILVKGSGNRLTIAAAKRLEVTGPENVIAIAAVDFARLHSAGNTLKYKRGLTRGSPDVAALGDNNSIVQGE